MVPEMESQGSDHASKRVDELTGRRVDRLLAESSACLLERLAMMSARVTVAAVPTSEMREGLIPADFATFSSESPLRRNSEGRRLSAGTEARLRPEAVSLISTLPLWSSRL